VLRTDELQHGQPAGPENDRHPWHGDRAVLPDEAEFYRRLFHGMRCGILAIDRQDRLVLLNALAAQILDLDQIPHAGTPIAEALGAHPQLLQVLGECFAIQHLPNREELVLGSGTEPRKTIGYTLSLIGRRGEEAVGAAVFFKDLTVIEQKAEQERLRDRLAALGQMAASLAHEIRNPLASIEVTCSLLRRRLGGDESARALLEKIAAEIRRLNRTITSSLEFVRPVSLQVAQADILAVLEEAITVAADRRGDRSVSIVPEFDAAVPALMMDRAQIRQVFENLLLNAVEAVGEGGTVRVQARMVNETRPASSCSAATPPVESSVEVRVIDDGPGITEDERDKIFHPFFTTKKSGSGVGLSMAKKIVDSHRGSIAAENAASGGAVFTVRLPTVPGQTED